MNSSQPGVTIDRLQAYMRQVLMRGREVVAVPPFTLFFHQIDANTYFNYAIPDEPAGAYLREPLVVLRREFRARSRRPRFEFIEEYAPDLAPALRANGFAEESRTHLMVCTPSTLQPTPETGGMTIQQIDATTPLDLVQEHLDTNSRGFEPSAEATTLEKAENFRGHLGKSRGFTVYLEGQAAGAGMFTAPLDGLTELVGIATLEAFRRRGVATALTAHATRSAFAQGVEVAFLSAADERAGRVYERIGFRPFATMLAYVDET
jgi:ribosomal protein S18 acetylase RimI-like enzyme